jgi:hypothetical protein
LATASVLDPKYLSIHEPLSRPFFSIALEGFESQLQKTACKGDLEGFKELLDAIPAFHQKLSRQPKDAGRFFSVAKKSYRALNHNNKKHFAPYLIQIQQGETCTVAIEDKTPLTTRYVNQIHAVRGPLREETRNPIGSKDEI